MSENERVAQSVYEKLSPSKFPVKRDGAKVIVTLPDHKLTFVCRACPDNVLHSEVLDEAISKSPYGFMMETEDTRFIVAEAHGRLFFVMPFYIFSKTLADPDAKIEISEENDTYWCLPFDTLTDKTLPDPFVDEYEEEEEDEEDEEYDEDDLANVVDVNEGIWHQSDFI